MRAHYLACFIALASLGAATSACSSNQDGSKNGEMGKLDFSYTSWSCLLGCDSDREVLQGSAMAMTVDGADPNHTRHAHITNPSLGNVSSDAESCECEKTTGSSSTIRGADNGSTCASDETRRCTMAVEIQTLTAGDAELEVDDENGNVIDRYPVHIRPATRVEAVISAGGNEIAASADGAYEVHEGSQVSIQPRGYGSGANELLFEKNGFTFGSSDEKIVKPMGLSFFEDVQPLEVSAAGTASVNVMAIGAQTEVRFRVVP